MGPIAAAIGTGATLYGIGTILVLATVAVLFSRDVRTIRRRDAADEHVVVSTSA